MFHQYAEWTHGSMLFQRALTAMAGRNLPVEELMKEGMQRHNPKTDPPIDVYAEYGRTLAASADIWRESGYPIVQVADKLAAALSVTDLRAFNEFEAPWNAFFLEIPHSAFGSQIHVFYARIRNQHCLSIEAKNRSFTGTSQINVWGATWGEVLRKVLHEQLSPNNGQANRQALLSVLRTFFGVCTELSANRPTNAPPRKGSPAVYSQAAGPPKVWRFLLTRPVRVDLRQHVRDYAAGKTKTLHTRYLTRGHYQRYGADKVWKWKEPFWNGSRDVDAPIAVRPHILGPTDC